MIYTFSDFVLKVDLEIQKLKEKGKNCYYNFEVDYKEDNFIDLIVKYYTEKKYNITVRKCHICQRNRISDIVISF
jgi:hypothetical protein